MLKRSTDGKQRVLSLSYGKDSMACLGACELLGWSLDRIVTADVWATDEIEADLPPMVEFKAKADKIILERYGIQVEHFYAIRDGEKDTFERLFYTQRKQGGHIGEIVGWTLVGGCEAQSRLKMGALKLLNASSKGLIQYIGIAADEPNRFHNLNGKTKLSPLVEIGWTEQDAKTWAEKNGLLSPLYDNLNRGGCFFCPSQSINNLRCLRKTYPHLWGMMLRWDSDLIEDQMKRDRKQKKRFSPNGKTLHDYEERFKLEDEGFIYPDERWNWSKLNEELNYRWF